MPDENKWANVVFNSLAAGTFLYIGASHIVAEEFEKINWRWTKMLLFLVGAVIMMVVTYVEF